MLRRVIFFILHWFPLLLLAQEPPTNSVKLMFIGDIMGHGPQLKAAYNKQTKSYNYDANYQYITSSFNNADFVIGNLEVTLGVQPYAGYPTFSSPPELAQAIKNAGINVLGTANNHACDRRKKGIVSTIKILDSIGIQHFGTYTSAGAKDSLTPLIIEKNNIKIALLNYTYGTNGIPVPKGTKVNLLDKKEILKDIQKAKEQQPDQIIAFVHWGQQYKNLPVTSQKKWFQFFKENGVSIVIGSHPHVVEPMQWNQKENTLVVYSLGNFISNQRTFPRDGAVIFELELTKKSGKTDISNADYISTWVYKVHYENGWEFYVLPIDEFAYKPYFFSHKNDYLKMKKYAAHIRTLLQKNNVNIPENKSFSNRFFQLMRELYMPFVK